MRVISGIYKRRRFDVPHTFKARPTTDFAKENLFNVLSNNYFDFEDGVTALDLFAGTGSIDHAVQIGAVLRAQGQGLDIRLAQAVLFQVSQPGQVLVLLHEGQQGIVGAHGRHGGGLGHAPRKNFGVLPQIQAVLHKVAFKAVFAQGAVFHLLQKLGLQTLLPHGQVGLHQRRDKGQVSHGQNLPSG